jgi:hypothetical protein
MGRVSVLTTLALLTGVLAVPASVVLPAALPAADAAGTGTYGHTDFDGDGDDELVIATPSESLGTIQDAGAVTVLDGSPSGVVTVGAQLWTQGTAGLSGMGETGDRFGESWTSGDFDEDGYDDLAIGIPADNLRGAIDAGRVQVLFGTSTGLSTTGQQLVQEAGVDVPEQGDLFGTAVAAGDFDNDGDDDLAVGARGEDVGGDAGAGAVFLYRANAQGFTSNPTLWTQDTAGVAGAAEPGDAFGSALAAGRVGHGARDDLVVGVPRENLTGAVDGGLVQVLYGAGAGFSTANDELFELDDFSLGTSGPISGDVLSTDAGDRFGTSVAITEQGGTESPIVVAGAPFDNDPGLLGRAADIGSVAVMLGVPGSGLEPAGGQSPSLVGDLSEFVPGVRYGSAVTGVGSGQWVVGWPGHDGTETDTDVGLISTFEWTEDDEGSSGGENRDVQESVGEDSEDGDEFGAGLWAADVDGDGVPELVIGWRESLEDEGVEEAGMVAVGPPSGEFERFTQSTPGVPETSQNFDRFGTQLVP